MEHSQKVLYYTYNEKIRQQHTRPIKILLTQVKDIEDDSDIRWRQTHQVIKPCKTSWKFNGEKAIEQSICQASTKLSISRAYEVEAKQHTFY